MNNALFPWVILVPRIDGASEITDITADERAVLMEEIAHAAQAMQTLHRPDKMNVAMLGNKVRQLHVHVIARFTGDSAWPEPVWGGRAEPYDGVPPFAEALGEMMVR